MTVNQLGDGYQHLAPYWYEPFDPTPFEEYQQVVIETSRKYYNQDGSCADLAMALAEIADETGEAIKWVKRDLRDAVRCHRDESCKWTDVDIKEGLTEEIGDSIWALVNLANIYGITLEDIIRKNVGKLCP